MEISERFGMDGWKRAVEAVRTAGEKRNTADGDTISVVRHLLIELHDLSDGDVLLAQMRDIGEYPTVEELDSALFAKRVIPGVSASIGGRMLSFGNICNTKDHQQGRDNLHGKDQLHSIVIPALKRDLSSTCIITFVDPVKEGDCLPLQEMTVTVRDGKLVVTGIFGSCDILLGWPALVFQLRKLQEYIAGQVGVQPGSIVTWCREAVVSERFLDAFGNTFKLPGNS